MVAEDRDDATHRPDPGLSARDAEVLDALLSAHADAEDPGPQDAAGFDQAAAAVPAGDAARAGRVAAWLSLLQRCPADDPPDDLVRRTMNRVAEARQRERFATQVQQLAGGGSPFRWGDLLTLAAVVLIGLSVVWPMLEKGRADARRIACANNLRAAGMGFSRYAADFAGLMPRRGTWPGSEWWKVGAEAPEDGPVPSNSAHMFLLVRLRYNHPADFNCPENPDAPRTLSVNAHDWPSPQAVSYSGQSQYTPLPIRLREMAHEAVLADRNPLFVVRAVRQTEDGPRQMRFVFRVGIDREPTSPSDAHQQRGQNVLLGSGSVTFRDTPVLPDGDNIWLVGGVDNYDGDEVTDTEDAFLVP